MSWLSDCQGDREYECYYEDWNYPYEQWCRDRDDPCPSWDDGGVLIREVHHSSGGDGW